jgi:hypothetical protein
MVVIVWLLENTLRKCFRKRLNASTYERKWRENTWMLPDSRSSHSQLDYLQRAFNNIEISFQSLCQTRHRVDRNSKRHWFVCCRLQVAPIMPQGSRLENIFRAGVMDATWRLWSTRKELAGWCFLLPVAWS